MKNNLYLTNITIVISFFLFFPNFSFSQSGCPNMNFIQGNFTNWNGFTGMFTNCCPNPGIVNGRHTIMNAPATDPRTGNLLQVLPPGENYSAKLGNEQVGAQAERLRYEFMVTPQSALLIYKYAVVFQDPSHTAADQPKFHIRILDGAGNLIDPICGFYSVHAGPNAPGFQTATGNIRWKDWTTVGMDLTPYMGQMVIVEYTTFDCALYGHYGYAYLSATCGPLEVSFGFCPGVPTTAQAPDGFASYLWSPGGETTQTITIANPVIGTTYSVLMTSHNGCQVTLNAALDYTNTTADFTVISQLCSDTVAFADASFVNQGFVDTWLWDFGDGNTSTQQNPIHVYAAPGTYTVTLIAGSLGCMDTTSQVIVVASPPIADAGNDQIICTGQSANFTATGGVTYLWSNGQNTQNINVSPPITTTYIVTVTDTNGCTATDKVLLTVNPSPTPFAGPNTQICFGESVNLQASGGNTYQWSPTTGLSNPNIATPVATPTVTTTYIVSVTDQNGCTATASAVIALHPNPIADAGPNQSICDGSQATLSASGGVSYVWDTGDNSQNIFVSPSTTTQYTVTVTNVNGCSDTDDVIVTVNYPPLVDAGNDTYICTGHSTILTATGGVSYLWSPTTFLSNPSIANPVANPPTPTTYTVTVTDANGCSASDDVFIDIFPSPVVDFTAVPLNGCQPLLVSFTDHTTPAIQTWTWDFGDYSSSDNSSSLQNPTHLYNASGIYTVSLSVVTTDGCPGSLTIPNLIEVYPNPIADFFMSPSITMIDNASIFFQDQSHLANFWAWDFGDPSSGALNYSNLQNPMHTYLQEGTYYITLNVQTIHGCVDETEKELIVKPDWTFYIPNVFTPDGDGINDNFQGYGTNITEYLMYIFNRWGELLYETEDYNMPWNGKDVKTGRDHPQDVYVYKIIIKDIHGKTHKYYGHVTLLR